MRERERERREREREDKERLQREREENITSFLTGISEINPLKSIIRSI